MSIVTRYQNITERTTPMEASLFANGGAHVLVDGQFGSTGKGVLASWLAVKAAEQGVAFDLVFSNAGPNSGHTFYHNGEKHVLKQLPTFAVKQALLQRDGHPTLPWVPAVVLSAGAVINPEILTAEAMRYPELDIFVHPCAAVITPVDIDAEHSGTVAAVAGTRSGTGAALARKVLRDPEAVVKGVNWQVPRNIHFQPPGSITGLRRCFVEVSQGFSLGLNSPEFYPKVTSRECTVMQALADARIPPRSFAKAYMSIRTFPIRVGNVEGYSSGDWYPDQQELSWEQLGVEAERTTVTNRIRRVATFSDIQYREALRANDPDYTFINFLNYLPEEAREAFIQRLTATAIREGKHPRIIGGFGPSDEDVRLING